MSAATEMAIFGTIYCAAVALVIGVPVLIFGNTSVALAGVGAGWVVWVAICGLAGLIAGR